MRFDFQVSNEPLDNSQNKRTFQIERAKRTAYVWRYRAGRSIVHDLKVHQSASHVVMQHAFQVVRRIYAVKTVLS
jgi:hypothetical protein